MFVELVGELGTFYALNDNASVDAPLAAIDGVRVKRPVC